MEYKVLEMVFRKKDDNYQIELFYTNGEKILIPAGNKLPKGIVLNRHYSITDIYGATVIDDRKDF